MADVEIGEISTRVEITDRPVEQPGDFRRLIENVLHRLSETQQQDKMRDRDGRIRDRSWKSDVKPD